MAALADRRDEEERRADRADDQDGRLPPERLTRETAAIAPSSMPRYPANRMTAVVRPRSSRGVRCCRPDRASGLIEGRADPAHEQEDHGELAGP